MRNAYGLFDQRISSASIMEEPTRCAAPMENRFGAGIFVVASYMEHNSQPNVSLTFSHYENKQPFLVAKANRSIKKGEPLYSCFINETQLVHENGVVLLSPSKGSGDDAVELSEE